MLEFIQANGRARPTSPADPDETEQMIVGIAAGERTVEESRPGSSGGSRSPPDRASYRRVLPGGLQRMIF
jgi:hypothetical protein